MISGSNIIHNRYKIIREIARGGMGVVYLAEDQVLEGDVALKFSLLCEDRFRAAFEREAKLLANLRHPGLPRVIDHFFEGDAQALAMDYVPGDSLLDLLENPLQRNGRGLPASKVLEWADQLLLILKYLHERDPPVIHRDVKPQNIKLMPNGQLVLLDFGLAKGTTATSVLGASLAYAPIEQINGSGTNHRTDLFSVGASIYHLLTGDIPWLCTARMAALHEGQPDPLPEVHEINNQVSQEVSDVIAWAMSLNAAQRPATAEELRLALNQSLTGTGVSTPRRKIQTNITPPITVRPDVEETPTLTTRLNPNSVVTEEPTKAKAEDLVHPLTGTLDGSQVENAILEATQQVAAFHKQTGDATPLSVTVPALPLLATKLALAADTAKDAQQSPPYRASGVAGPAAASVKGLIRKKPRRTSFIVVAVVALCAVVVTVIGLWRVTKLNNSNSEAPPVEKPTGRESKLTVTTYLVKNENEQAIDAVKHQFNSKESLRFGVQSSPSGVLCLLSKDQSGLTSIIRPDREGKESTFIIPENKQVRVPPTTKLRFRNSTGAEFIYFVFAQSQQEEIVQSIERILGKGERSIKDAEVGDLFARLDRQAIVTPGESGKEVQPKEAPDTNVIVGQGPLVWVLRLNHQADR